MPIVKKVIAKAVVALDQFKNKLEADYASYLHLQMLAGEIVQYEYEKHTLKLAHDTRYTPDFFLQLNDGTIEFHETKGFMRDDARVKLKVAAAQFPYRFILVTRKGKNWILEEVK